MEEIKEKSQVVINQDRFKKERGPGRDILFINEANLIDRDTFLQLLMLRRE